MTNILEGKTLAKKIKSDVQRAVRELNTAPTLAAIIIGEDPASKIYVAHKQKACDETGIQSKLYTLPSSVKEEEVIALLDALNKDPTISGILLQQPLPSHLPKDKLIQFISPDKDVDGFHPLNMGKLLTQDNTGFVPCTPLGIIELMKYYHISTSHKNVVIVGRSQIVGRPLAALLMQSKSHGNATVTVTHSKTKDLKMVTSRADILISAIGKPQLISPEYIKDKAIVIDVGINRMPNNKLVGDVDFDKVKEKASMITQVPGGIGPLTVACLMKNTLKAYSHQK